MARTREFDETEALSSAMRVFCEKGYEATSLQDLEQAMSLNRTSIYNAFGNKRSIFQKVLKRYVEMGRECWEAVLSEAPSAKESINNMLNKAVDMYFDPNGFGNCLVVLSTLEKSQHDRTSQKMIEQALQTFQDLIYKRLDRGKKSGEFQKGFDVRGVSAAITSIFSGFIVLGKANFPKATVRKAVQASIKLLD